MIDDALWDRYIAVHRLHPAVHLPRRLPALPARVPARSRGRRTEGGGRIRLRRGLRRDAQALARAVSGTSPSGPQQGFDERFMHTWEFYLAYCEAAFAESASTWCSTPWHDHDPKSIAIWSIFRWDCACSVHIGCRQHGIPEPVPRPGSAAPALSGAGWRARPGCVSGDWTSTRPACGCARDFRPRISRGTLRAGTGLPAQLHRAEIADALDRGNASHRPLQRRPGRAMASRPAAPRCPT